MTLNEAAYNILNLLVGGRSTNNEYYSIEQIKFNIKYYRALLIRREIDRVGGGQISGGGQGGSHNSGTSLVELTQTLVVPTEATVVTPTGLFPDIEVSSNAYISLEALPKYIRAKGRSGIISVGFKTFPIPMIYIGESVWRQFNKYSSFTTFCFIDDETDKLVVQNWTHSSDPILKVVGIFEDPEDAYDFNDPDDDWDDDVNEFPLPLDLYQRIVSSLLSGEFQVLIQTDNDTKQDHLPDHQIGG